MSADRATLRQIQEADILAAASRVLAPYPGRLSTILATLAELWPLTPAEVAAPAEVDDDHAPAVRTEAA
jgi:hypothetical protein